MVCAVWRQTLVVTSEDAYVAPSPVALVQRVPLLSAVDVITKHGIFFE